VRRGLHLGKIWLTCTIGVLTVWAAVSVGFAIVNPFWHDRLITGMHEVQVIVTGDEIHGHCGRSGLIPQHRWQVEWVERGHLRRGFIQDCQSAPRTGSTMRAYAGAHRQLTTESTTTLIRWWPVISLGMGALLAVAWVNGRGRASYRAIRAATRTA
jgi:hypothetical protein